MPQSSQSVTERHHLTARMRRLNSDGPVTRMIGRALKPRSSRWLTNRKSNGKSAAVFFTRERGKRILKRLIPCAENVIGAVIMAGVAAVEGPDAVHSYFDLNFIYIGAMGLLYGKYHGFLAAAFSTLLLSFSYVSEGSDRIDL